VLFGDDVGSFRDHVADGDELGQRVRCMTLGVTRPDAAYADNSYF
jgi:hypothetical protein